MDPRRAIGLERQGLTDRIVAVVGLAVVVALVQPDAAAAEQIDRRIEVHQPTSARRVSPTKLASSAMPAAPDFSGWNWVAITFPRWAIAVTSPP